MNKEPKKCTKCGKIDANVEFSFRGECSSCKRKRDDDDDDERRRRNTFNGDIFGTGIYGGIDGNPGTLI